MVAIGSSGSGSSVLGWTSINTTCHWLTEKNIARFYLCVKILSLNITTKIGSIHDLANVIYDAFVVNYDVNTHRYIYYEMFPIDDEKAKYVEVLIEL